MRLRLVPSLALTLLGGLLAGCAAASPVTGEPPTESSATTTETTSPTPMASTETPVPTRGPTPAPGTTRTDEFGIEQVWVPAGTFQMGSSEEQIDALRSQDPPDWVKGEFGSEQPQHKVLLTVGYWIDKYEVTNASFKAFIDAGGYQNQAYWSESGWVWLSHQTDHPQSCLEDEPNTPRVCVTWFEAEGYAAWRGGRLPTEAEWEFAARGPESRVYPWGDEFDPARCNVVDSTSTVAVGSFPEGISWIGAHDLCGNAMEWVSDWLNVNYYKDGDMTDPDGPATGTKKVEKGGWWGSNPFVARSAYRHYEDPPSYSDHHIGFRIVTP